MEAREARPPLEGQCKDVFSEQAAAPHPEPPLPPSLFRMSVASERFQQPFASTGSIHTALWTGFPRMCDQIRLSYD